MTNYLSVVEQVMASLGYPNRTSEAGSFQVTKAAASEIHGKYDPNCGLLKKTTGNNIDGCSVDCLFDRSTGEVVDVIRSSGSPDSAAQWLVVDNIGDLTRWVEPPALPAPPDPPTPPTPPDPPAPPAPDPTLAALLAETQAIRVDVAEIRRILVAAAIRFGLG